MKLIDKINTLFAQDPLKKLVFYFDEDGSFVEELAEIEAAGIEVIQVDDRYFSLKYQLEVERQGQAIFLYHSFAKPKGKAIKTYPLLDLLKANHELRLDEASEFLDTYGLPDHHLPLVKRYIKQLKKKTVQKKLAKILDRQHFDESNLKQGLISLSLDFYSVQDRISCMIKTLIQGLEADGFQKLQTTLEKWDLDQELLSWFNQLLDLSYQELSEENLKDMAQRIKYNVLTAYLPHAVSEDTYAKLKLERSASINRLQAFFQEWQSNASLTPYIDPVFQTLATDINTANLLDWYGSEAAFGYYSEDMLISSLRNLYESALYEPLKTKDECNRWQKNKSLDVSQSHQIEYLYHCCSFIALLQAYPSFRFNGLQDYVREYTQELYKLDQYYRKALIAFDKVRDRLYELEEVAFATFEELNKQYDRFLKELNVEWQTALEEVGFDYRKLDVSKQYDFFKQHLKEKDYKIVVIISDALRYELGHELLEALLSDSRNKVAIEPSLASIPSYTNLGMTNLLPHQGIEVEKGESDLAFSIGGKTTVSSNRAAILQQAEPESTTIDFAQVMKLDQTKGRAFFKNHRMVYIYHDWIDAIGDKRRTEHQSFEASEKALEDIKRLIQKLYGWNVYHVLVTSDHGFLYNYNELPESSRENLPKAKGYSRDHVRFVVADEFEEEVVGYELKMSNTTDIQTDLKVALPRAINRYRKQGNVGLQFVHGGASLQELVTPVLTFYKQKKESNEIVSFKRIDQNKRITTGSIKLSLIQDQPVSSEYKALEVVFGIYSDTGELLSNERSVHFDAVSPNPKDRVQEIILTLNTKGSKASLGYIKAFDTNDKSRLNPVGVNDLVKISSLMEKDEF